MSVKGQINPQQLTYDFEMSPNARWHHTVPIENNTGAIVNVKGIKIVTNAKITNPGQFLSPYWSKVVTTVNADNTLYTYTLTLDTPLAIPQNKTSLLDYDIGDCLGPVQKVPMPPQAIQISDGQTWTSLNWTKAISPQPRPHPNFILQMYHASWGQYRQKDPRTIANEPWNAINRLCYAFIGFDETGAGFSLDSWGDEAELPLLYKQKRATTQDDPNTLKTTIGFGGWTNAGKRMDTVFSKMAADPVSRQRFIKNAVDAVQALGVDGIVIDWEYPVTSVDAENFVLLLEGLRAELNKRIGNNAILTIAGPGGNDKIAVMSANQWKRIGAAVTQIEVMCYDYYGAWGVGSDVADFHAAWELDDNSPHKKTGSKYDIQSTLALYQQNGVPLNEVVLGAPSYARAVIVRQPGPFAGLYQDIVGAPAGEYNEEGFYSWNAINNLLNKQPSALDDLGVKEWQFYDSDHPFCQKAGMCMLSGALPDGRWVTLNFLDQKAAHKRGELAKQFGLAGAMEWANYCEPVEAKNTIIQAVSDGLDGMKLEAKRDEVAKPKEEVFQKTSIKTRVKEYTTKLRGFFGSTEKANILEKFNQTKGMDSNDMSQLLQKDAGKKLRTHRNLIKRFFSWLLPKGWIAEPNSYRLAKELYETRQLFDPKNHPPTKVISGDRNLPSKMVMGNSYENIRARTNSVEGTSAMAGKDCESQERLPAFAPQYSPIVHLPQSRAAVDLRKDAVSDKGWETQPSMTLVSAPVASV